MLFFVFEVVCWILPIVVDVSDTQEEEEDDDRLSSREREMTLRNWGLCSCACKLQYRLVSQFNA